MKHLHFHLGPVQGFFAEARRTRDIWAGSFLLSRLVGEAMAWVEESGGTVLDPILDQDPMLVAIGCSREYSAFRSDRVGSPFLGTIPNHFVAAVSDSFDPSECRALIFDRWSRIGDAVRDLLFTELPLAEELDGKVGRGVDPRAVADQIQAHALEVFKHQIGTAEACPAWEVYWVLVPESEAGLGRCWLDARKAFRHLPDQPVPTEEGDLCSMMPAWVEISGAPRWRKGDQQRAFWRAVRRRILDVRYGPNHRRNPEDCLDLAEGEALCAPALVKRLFPLLALSKTIDGETSNPMIQAIGWKPEARASVCLFERHDPTFLQKLTGIIFNQKTPAGQYTQIEDLSDPGARQSMVFWPSTSFISAAHWIARAQRSAPSLCKDFALSIAELSPKYALAERELWLQCLASADQPTDMPLGSIDGAMFFESDLKRAVEEAGRGENALRLLREISKATIAPAPGSPSDSSGEDPAKVGSPAPYYAVLRMDGDHIGKFQRTSDENRVQGSKSLADFARLLRGDPSNKKLGLVVENNGVLIFAGGDDLLAFFPVEDALEAALKIRDHFIDLFSHLKAAPTISGAVTLAHRRVPLRWVMRSNAELLENTAKKVMGRDALAVEVLEVGGLRTVWAAPFSEASTLHDVVTYTVQENPILATNAFYHRLRDHLDSAAFDETVLFEKRVHLIRTGRGVGPESGDEKVLLQVLMFLLGGDEGACGSDVEELARKVLELSRLHFPTDEGGHRRLWGRLDWSGLQIVRMLANAWRKDVGIKPKISGSEDRVA